MSNQHAKPGEVVHLPLGAALASSRTTTIVKTAELELVRLVIPTGKGIPTHKSPGEITVQCLEGKVAFVMDGKTKELNAGQLLHLPAGTSHSLTGLENSSLLLTLMLHEGRSSQRLDVVQEASEESFPASDSPAW